MEVLNDWLYYQIGAEEMHNFNLCVYNFINKNKKSSESDKIVEDVFGIILVFEAFLLW